MAIVFRVKPWYKEKKKEYDYIWVPKNFTGISSSYGRYFSGRYIWTDGGDYVYYSNSSTQLALKKGTTNWVNKTWNNLSNFYGDSVWSDGDNIYYSRESQQYVLDKNTNTWNVKTWNGLNSFTAAFIWFDDKKNIYMSRDYDHYMLIKDTSTWVSKYDDFSRSNFTYFSGEDMWTDGKTPYYSSSSTQKYTFWSGDLLVWVTTYWTGLSSFNGCYVWTDGKYIFYSNGNKQYYLLPETKRAYTMSWTGLTSFYGNAIWTDGINIYYSTGDTSGNVTHYELT